MRFAPALLSVLIALSSALPAVASFNTGNDLVRYCEHEKSGYCLGYIIGVSDDFLKGKMTDGQICLREHVTASQVRDAVLRWLDENPSARDFTASSLVRAAMQNAFPCS